MQSTLVDFLSLQESKLFPST